MRLSQILQLGASCVSLLLSASVSLVFFYFAWDRALELAASEIGPRPALFLWPISLALGSCSGTLCFTLSSLWIHNQLSRT